jgi:hypothetical protein
MKVPTGTSDPAIADNDAALLSIATLTGVIPSNWTTAIDVMIPKKKLSEHVTKLRIIVLVFHALFNMRILQYLITMSLYYLLRP